MRNYERVEIIEKDKRNTAFQVTTLIQQTATHSFLTELIFNWVCNNIKYVKEQKDYWKTPRETIIDGEGDCEDGAILLASLFYSLLPKSERWKVFVHIYERPAHAVVVYDGTVYDWTQKRVFPLQEISDWKLWYMFNFRHAYTTKENVKKWRR